MKTLAAFFAAISVKTLLSLNTQTGKICIRRFGSFLMLALKTTQMHRKEGFFFFKD